MNFPADLEIGDIVKGTFTYSAPHPDDPHPENPSRKVQRSKTIEGPVLEVQENKALVRSSKGAIRLDPSEIEEIVEKGDPPEPVRFTIKADEETWTVVWVPDKEYYWVKDTSQFKVTGTPDGDVRSKMNVYKNIDRRVKDRVRKTKSAVADALREKLNAI